MGKISRVKVGVNGYGTIGRRVAEAILRQPDMELVGVTKATPDYRMEEARHKGIRVFSTGNARLFEDAGYSVDGSLAEMLQQCDIVVDCSPKGRGRENLAIYNNYPGLRAIFQGGEKHDLTGFSFNSDCNFAKAADRRWLRVVSCNTTALCRVISTLNTNYRVKKVRACLVRRSADQSESDSSIINSWAPDPNFPSHHSLDVQTVMPGVGITTLAGIAPMTLMHGHMLFFELEGGRPSDVSEVISALQSNPRILMCSFRNGLTSTAKLKDLFALNGRNGDLYEVCVWNETIGVDSDGEVGMHIAIDQQADVVPENIDAIRAMLGTMAAEDSIALTNSSLGIGKLVKSIARIS